MSVFEGVYTNGSVTIQLDAENESDLTLTGLLTTEKGEAPLQGKYVPRDSSHERYLFSLCGSMKTGPFEHGEPPFLFLMLSIAGFSEWNNESPSLTKLTMIFSFANDINGHGHDTYSDERPVVYSRVPQ